MIRAFFRFWRDFLIGDDWRIAAGVTSVLAAGAVLVATGAVADAVVAALMALGFAVVAAISLR